MAGNKNRVQNSTSGKKGSYNSGKKTQKQTKSIERPSFNPDQRLEQRKKSPSQHSLKPLQVMVNGYSEQWLRQQFDWVYAQEVISIGTQVKAGSIVEILSTQGHVLGTGVFAGEFAEDTEQSVLIRRFSERTVSLDEDFFTKRLTKAISRRTIESQTNAWRIVHSENDDLPGIVVDTWEQNVSITLSCPSLQGLLPAFLSALGRVHPFENAVGHVRLPHGKQQFLGMLKGEVPEELVVQELGIQYWVSPHLSKDAGLFLDMRPLRAWLARQSWQQKTFLNLFCYTGAFSVSAAVHGASHVTSVDLSKHYLERAQRNFQLNHLDLASHEFIESDSFQALDRMRRKGDLYDVVLADPPSFSHSDQGTWSVQTDLKRLVIACLRVLKPGGTLIISTNHGKMPPRDFSKAILDAARKEKRRLRLLLNYAPGTDFPAALHFPEARYLKCWVMEAE